MSEKLSEYKSNLVNKYYAEDAMCKSDLADLLDEYETYRAGYRPEKSKTCANCREIERHQNLQCSHCIKSSCYESKDIMLKRDWVDNWNPDTGEGGMILQTEFENIVLQCCNHEYSTAKNEKGVYTSSRTRDLYITYLKGGMKK
jgi:hypothetical protein